MTGFWKVCKPDPVFRSLPEDKAISIEFGSKCYFFTVEEAKALIDDLEDGICEVSDDIETRESKRSRYTTEAITELESIKRMLWDEEFGFIGTMNPITKANMQGYQSGIHKARSMVEERLVLLHKKKLEEVE